MKKIKAISLFSSAWIWEYYLKSIWIDVVVANEIIKKRSECYEFLYPESKMINGDIRDPEIKKAIKAEIKDDIKILIATPPCQWVSTLWKNKSQDHYEKDKRNFLIFDTMEIIDYWNFDYILIENVPKFLKMLFPYNWNLSTLEDILIDKYSDIYEIKITELNVKDYWVSQSRPRGIIRIYKKWLHWDLPKKSGVINLEKAIWHLPSLEAWENSDILWHFAKAENERYTEALKHTPTWCSAMKNDVFFPKKEDWTRMKGFHNTFKRMQWNQPAPARTTFCWNVNSHNNVHPWRLLPNWVYSDARALTPLETLIVSSLPEDTKFPEWSTLSFINTIIWEAVPPILLKKLFLSITN